MTDPDEMQTQDTSKAYEQVKIEEEKQILLIVLLEQTSVNMQNLLPVVGRQHWRTQLFLPGISTKFKKERAKGASILGFG